MLNFEWGMEWLKVSKLGQSWKEKESRPWGRRGADVW
jgi:hypothetical protein